MASSPTFVIAFTTSIGSRRTGTVSSTRPAATPHWRREAGEEIVWLTGRPGWLRSTTLTWLATHNLPTDNLFMRPARDFRPAAALKVDVLRSLLPRGISLFVDDDPDVIRAAARAGITTRLATWVPHSKTLHDAQEHAGRT
jgi:hypothetical protein